MINIPLIIANAITFHKVQGYTLDRFVIKLGASEDVFGLTYVALSRVRELSHLRLHPFLYKRLLLKSFGKINSMLDMTNKEYQRYLN